MTDAPESIWVHYEAETDDATWSEYPSTDGVGDFKHYGEYTRSDIFQERIAQLEAALQCVLRYVNTSGEAAQKAANEIQDTPAIDAVVFARAALKPKP
jgi:hypothetical protein